MQSTLTAPEANSPALKPDDRAGKYLTFMIGKEEFGVGVLKVREIMGIQDITAVPQTPPYLKGVINLRSRIVPVVDLRLKLGLPPREYKPRTCIVVVQIGNATAGKLTMGMVVDSVAAVLTLRPSDIQRGVVRVKGKITTLLDLDGLLSTEEMQSLVAVSR